MVLTELNIKINRKAYGEYLTPVEISKEFILPEIRNCIYNYIWVDLFAGEGNLILPILEIVPLKYRVEFFKNNIFMFDIQESMVRKAIENAMKYGIPYEVAKQNIQKRNSIADYPSFLLDLPLPIFHITNPPYLYIGHIKKQPELQDYLKYFEGENKMYQDLYQLALVNDLRFGIRNMIYIIPSNFIFGYSVSNKIRSDILYFYKIRKAVIFEKRVFEYTGTNVIICFFERKDSPKHEIIKFEGLKISKEGTQKRVYILRPEYNYRAGNEFEEFLREFKSTKPLEVSFYLTVEEVEMNRGPYEVEVIDANTLVKSQYKKMKIYVNQRLFDKIKSNVLFIRTLDTGTADGKAGLYLIKEVFNVDGILVTKAKYRTHPIQLFISPKLSFDEQYILRDYFNLLLEYFRTKTDSEFMTTYKYSCSNYTRKYLGLSQAKRLIQTFPILSLDEHEKKYFIDVVKNKNVEDIIEYIRKLGKRRLSL